MIGKRFEEDDIERGGAHLLIDNNSVNHKVLITKQKYPSNNRITSSDHIFEQMSSSKRLEGPQNNNRTEAVT